MNEQWTRGKVLINGLPPILDMTCGGRMMWYDKKDPRILAFDCRREIVTLTDRGKIRRYEVNPDVMGDYRALPFPDESFYHVVFAPPHLVNAGKTGWLFKKYGKLERETWREDTRKAFAEAWRVMRRGSTMLFKFCTIQVPLREVAQLYPDKPIIESGIKQTYFIEFFKMP